MTTKIVDYVDFFINPIKPGYKRFLPLEVDPLREKLLDEDFDYKVKITGNEHNDGYYFGPFTIELLERIYDEEVDDFVGEYDNLVETIKGNMNSHSQLDGVYRIFDEFNNLIFLLDFKDSLPNGRFYYLNISRYLKYGLYNNGIENKEWYEYTFNQNVMLDPNMIVYDEPLPEENLQNVTNSVIITTKYNDDFTAKKQVKEHSVGNRIYTLLTIKIKQFFIDNYSYPQDVIIVRRKHQKPDVDGYLHEYIDQDTLYNSRYENIVIINYYEQLDDSDFDAIERLSHPHTFNKKRYDDYTHNHPQEFSRYVDQILPSGEKMVTTYEFQNGYLVNMFKSINDVNINSFHFNNNNIVFE